FTSDWAAQPRPLLDGLLTAGFVLGTTLVCGAMVYYAAAGAQYAVLVASVFSVVALSAAAGTAVYLLRSLGLRAEAARRKSDAALGESVERLHLVVTGSGAGLWDVPVNPADPLNPANPVYFSPRFKELLGYQDHEFPPIIASWIPRLHTEDRERV